MRRWSGERAEGGAAAEWTRLENELVEDHRLKAPCCQQQLLELSILEIDLGEAAASEKSTAGKRLFYYLQFIIFKNYILQHYQGIR